MRSPPRTTSKTTFVALDVALALIRSLRAPVARIRRHHAKHAHQIVDAASSIAANLSEGNRRIGRDRLQHFRIAAGSADETRTHLLVAEGWGWVDASEIGEAALISAPKARIHGNITARAVVVHGRVERCVDGHRKLSPSVSPRHRELQGCARLGEGPERGVEPLPSRASPVPRRLGQVQRDRLCRPPELIGQMAVVGSHLVMDPPDVRHDIKDEIEGGVVVVRDGHALPPRKGRASAVGWRDPFAQRRCPSRITTPPFLYIRCSRG